MTLDAAPHFQKHCPGCFQLKSGAPVCPHCGYDEGVQRSPIFLPHGTILAAQYRVGRVLGRPGGFGITYLGWDVNLQQRVAIKEYMPREIAARQPNSLEVNVHTSDDKRGFEFGKEQFLREARIVAKLDHPNIVRVRNFFNANATAYLVMDYYEGMSLGDYLSSVRNKLEPELAVPLVKPILEGLQYVHERGLVHRDLKPHNIYLAAIGRPIVLDFGAARQAAGDRVQSLSVVLTEGYAPLEQYQRRAVQGPWTDVYGVAATLYRMITGAAPPIALDRIGRDPVEDGGWNAMPPTLVPALRMALAVRPSDRYQSAIEFLAALDRFMSGASATTGGMVGADKLAAAAPFMPLMAELAVTGAPRTREPVSTGGARPRPSIVDRVAPSVYGEGLRAFPNRAMPSAGPATGPTTGPITEPMSRAANSAMDASNRAMPAERPAAATFAARPSALDAALGAAAPSGPGAAPLYRRASDVPEAPSAGPAKPGRTQWVPMLFLLIAATALGYVLINPPGESEPPTVQRLPPASAPEGELAAAPVAAPEPAAEEIVVARPELITLPGGNVQLADASADAAAVPDASVVRVAPVRFGRTEVTLAQFADFVRRTGYDNPRWQNYPCESAGGRLPDWKDPGYPQEAESPVVCVSWADANAYAQWLTRESGQTWRLPTEAEWQYAARAGTNTRYWWGDGFEAGLAACQSCPPKVPTHPASVGSFPPNPFGLYETLGNVREWTCSRFDRYGTAAAATCSMSSEGTRAAVRGGSWLQNAEALAAEQREAYEPYRRNVWTGFRVVQDLTTVSGPTS